MTADKADYFGEAPRSRKKVVDSRALGVGGLIAGGSGLVGLIGALGHNVFFAGAAGGAEQSIGAIFLELLIFLGLLGIGLPAATFVSVWRGGGALAGPQGSAAIVAGWAAGFGPGAIAVPLLPGGSSEVFEVIWPLSPVYLVAQVLAAVAAWIGNRIRAARRAR